MTTPVSILPEIIPLLIERGDVARCTVPALDVDGQPMNLTGCLIAFSMKEKHGGTWDDSPAIVALTWSEGAPNGITVADVTTGIITVTISGALTATLSPTARYRYDVELTDAAGEPTTVVAGDVSVDADVTR